MTERLQIIENNPVTFCYELQKAVQEGFEIDESEEFSMFFNCFTIGMKKSNIPEELRELFEEGPLAKKAVGRPPKA